MSKSKNYFVIEFLFKVVKNIYIYKPENVTTRAHLNPTPTGWFWVDLSLKAAGFNILRFTIFLPYLVDPYKSKGISNN